MRAADGFEFGRHFGALCFDFGDVGRNLDHPVNLAFAVDQRIVGCLQPDFLAALADTLDLRGNKLAAIQLGPELLVVFALCVAGFAEER